VWYVVLFFYPVPVRWRADVPGLGARTIPVTDFIIINVFKQSRDRPTNKYKIIIRELMQVVHSMIQKTE